MHIETYCFQTGNSFTVAQIAALIGVVEGLEKNIVLDYDKAFDENIHDIVYDKNGNKRSVKDITDPDKDKVIKAYEEAHPDWKEDLEMLVKSGDPNTLTEEDIRNIKYIAYTAEEPYRSIFLDNVKEYQIGTIGHKDISGAFYHEGSDAIYFENNEDGFLEDPRGPYTTFFHENGHAIDCNESNTFLTHSFTYYSEEMGREVTLREAIYYDVYNDIEEQIRKHVNDDEHVNNILDAFRHGGKRSDLTREEKKAYDKVVEHYKSDLSGEENEAACDVYGGATDLRINSPDGYGHRSGTYWYVGDEPTGNQELELWAEYFSYCMTGDKEALESLRGHFPEASKVLDAIAAQMGVNVGTE